MQNVFVIDSHAERRTEVCRVLMHGGDHAEPFESVGEFLAFRPSEGIALVYDNDGTAANLCERMRDDPKALPVVAYCEDPALHDVVQSMQAGAASYFAWPFSLKTFSSEIERIEPELEKRFARTRRVAQARSQLASLTGREREVLVSLISHGTNKAIAKELDISPRTVEKYRAAILVRLGVANTAQAIRVAVEGGAFDDASAGPASPDETDDGAIID